MFFFWPQNGGGRPQNGDFGALNGVVERKIDFFEGKMLKNRFLRVKMGGEGLKVGI